MCWGSDSIMCAGFGPLELQLHLLLLSRAPYYSLAGHGHRADIVASSVRVNWGGALAGLLVRAVGISRGRPGEYG